MLDAFKNSTVAPPIAYTIAKFCEATGIGRTFAYQEIAAGRLAVVKAGRRTLIPATAARAWLENLKGAGDV